MNDIKYKIQTLIEKRDFDKLTSAEKEMVYSVMTEEEFTERREVLLRSKNIFESDRKLIVPDIDILNNLKGEMNKQVELGSEPEQVEARPFLWLSYKVSMVKSAIAMLLLLLGSYLLFANSEPRIEYIEKEIVVEKRIYDTIYSEKVIEVPVERIVKVVNYKTLPEKTQITKKDVSFVVQELADPVTNKKVSLPAMNNSYGNTKIDKDELEQFRVSL